jgi:hypothetical protein
MALFKTVIAVIIAGIWTGFGLYVRRRAAARAEPGRVGKALFGELLKDLWAMILFLGVITTFLIFMIVNN